MRIDSQDVIMGGILLLFFTVASLFVYSTLTEPPASYRCIDGKYYWRKGNSGVWLQRIASGEGVSCFED